MHITVKLFATFRNGRFKIAEQERGQETACRDVVLELGLTEQEIGIILVNGRHAELDHLLKNGDTLSLFPLVGGG